MKTGIFALAAAGLLAACASDGSYVSGVAAADGPAVAGHISRFVASQIKPASGAIRITPPEQDAIVAPSLATDLRNAGFTVDASGGWARHALRYDVQPFDQQQLLIRIWLDKKDAAGAFGRDPYGHLSPQGPFLVRELAP